jgi:hypothetical protein
MRDSVFEAYPNKHAAIRELNTLFSFDFSSESLILLTLTPKISVEELDMSKISILENLDCGLRKNLLEEARRRRPPSEFAHVQSSWFKAIIDERNLKINRQNLLLACAALDFALCK